MDCVALIKTCQLPLRPSSLGKLRLLLCYDSIKIIHKDLAISLSALVPATLVSPLKILRFLITVSPKCPTAGAMPYMFYVFPQMAYYPTLREKKNKTKQKKKQKTGAIRHHSPTSCLTYKPICNLPTLAPSFQTQRAQSGLTPCSDLYPPLPNASKAFIFSHQLFPCFPKSSPPTLVHSPQGL